MGKKMAALFFAVLIAILGLKTAKNAVPALRAVSLYDGGRAFVAQIDKAIRDNFAWRMRWVDGNGGVRRLMGNRCVEDEEVDVLKLDDGTLSYSLPKQEMKPYAEKLVRLQEVVRQTGSGPLIYVQIPFKLADGRLLERGMPEYGNRNADALLEALRRENVPTLDLRAEIRKEGWTQESLFFRTDHHWKPETALWAAGRICRYGAETCGLHEEAGAFDPSAYETITHKDFFLGALGKKTGRWYAGVDDFSLIVPRADTSFSFRAKDRKGTVEKRGDFSQVMLDKRRMEGGLYGSNPYATYMGGDHAINTVCNEKVGNDEHILLIRDSFSCAMQPYLCMNYRQVTAIDLREYDEMTLAQYLAQNRFDAVIVAYNPASFEKKAFSFF